jgi:hypothetical protein
MGYKYLKLNYFYLPCSSFQDALEMHGHVLVPALKRDAVDTFMIQYYFKCIKSQPYIRSKTWTI